VAGAKFPISFQLELGGKKMTRLTIIGISFIIVSFMFAGQSYGEIDPQTVLGAWLLDEGTGNIAEDASGNGNDGTLMGAPNWVAGQSGSALGFTGSGTYVDCGNDESLNVGVFSVSFWCNIPSTQSWNHMISRGQHGASGSPGSVNWGVMMYDAQETILFETFNDTSWAGITASTTTGEWHHVVATYDGDTMQLYHDGTLADSRSGLGILLDQSRAFLIGARSDAGSAGGFFSGSIDEVGYFNTVLTSEDIATIMNNGLAEITAAGRLLARRPNPEDGAEYSDVWVNLSWSAGDFAASHNVYMGDNFADVDAGTGDTFLANVPENNFMDPYLIVGIIGYPMPEGLVPGSTYYWRVDEVNDADVDSPWKGNVWSFSVPPRKAFGPTPADGAKFIETDVTLTWMAGFDTITHTVYFGEDFDTVSNATTGGVGGPFAIYTPPGPLESGKTYYWRVDESDMFETHKGDVWSFKTLPDIPMSDPNLMGWWKFDEGSSATALDWSGHGNHGTFKGDPQRVVGYDGDGLEFDGVGGYVEVPHDASLTVDTEVTVMAWIHAQRHPSAGGDWQGILAKSNNPRSYSFYTYVDGTLHFSTTSGGAYVGSNSTGQVPLNEWVHVAAMVAGGQHLYYINGEPAGTGGGGITLPGAADTATVRIGVTHEGGNNFLGMIDDVRVYNKALTQEEIKEAMRGDTRLAWNPSPDNGSTPDVGEAVPVTWSPGDNASQHDVYFGLDKDAVNDADASDTTGIYRGRQAAAGYTPPEGVEWGGGPYYWRIDEYNADATINKGRVWSFTVGDYLSVDDFEQYDIENAIWANWHDGLGYIDMAGVSHPGNGTGSEVGDATNTSSYMEEGIVHGGGKSMPYWYNNSGSTGKFNYSEAKLTLSDTRNWTEENVRALSLWFYGDPANAAEQMYLAVANNCC
jgi:hypothetical protein